MRKKSEFLHYLCGAGIAGLLLCGCEKEQTTAVVENKIKVEVIQLKPYEFRQQIRVQGVIEPIDEAVISARVAGTIDNFQISEGSQVKAGDILFTIDQKNLKNALVIAEQNHKVAVEIAKTAVEDVHIAEITLHKAELDYKRYQKLLKSNAVSQTTYETAETDYKRAVANLKKVQAVLNYNNAQVDQAAANLEIARKNFADSIVRAPFAGVISEKNCDMGEFASVGREVLKLEETEHLEISARISALYYDMISSATEVVIKVNEKELCRAKISYKSPSIDPISRTFEIKAKLQKSGGIINGMLCDIDIILGKRSGLGLPSNTVIARAGGANAVFVVNGDSAKEILIKTGFVTDGFTEIIDAEKLSGKNCISVGQFFLNDGSKIIVTGGK